MRWSQAHTGAIDLVIADVVMPGGTGPELVRALAVVRPGVPALYISGYADAVLAQERSQGQPFLQKPFRVELLTDRDPVRMTVPAACGTCTAE